jgi:hypothetical protein
LQLLLTPSRVVDLSISIVGRRIGVFALLLFFLATAFWLRLMSRRDGGDNIFVCFLLCFCGHFRQFDIVFLVLLGFLASTVVLATELLHLLYVMPYVKNRPI